MTLFFMRILHTFSDRSRPPIEVVLHNPLRVLLTLSTDPLYENLDIMTLASMIQLHISSLSLSARAPSYESSIEPKASINVLFPRQLLQNTLSYNNELHAYHLRTTSQSQYSSGQSCQGNRCTADRSRRSLAESK